MTEDKLRTLGDLWDLAATWLAAACDRVRDQLQADFQAISARFWSIELESIGAVLIVVAVFAIAFSICWVAEFGFGGRSDDR